MTRDRKLELLRRAAVILAALASFYCGACSTKPSVEKPVAIKPAPPPPVTVLLRQRDTGTLAADGLLWLFSVAMTYDKSSGEAKQKVLLNSDPRMRVEEESVTEIQTPVDEKAAKKAEWKKDPKQFDFLVSWQIDQHEQSKFSFGSDLVIDVAENWKAEKVSDAKVKKSWKCSYQINAGDYLGSKPEVNEQVAQQQIAKVIAPARAPILKELREFIAANRPSPAKTNPGN